MIANLPDDRQATAWVLADVPVVAWAVLDAVRWATGRPTRSAAAEDAIRRALAQDAEPSP